MLYRFRASQSSKLFCIVILLHFRGFSCRRQIFPDNGLTFDECNNNNDCTGNRECVFVIYGKIFECAQEYRRECLCTPLSLNKCKSSVDCVLGERCVSTSSGVNICVSCVAAKYVPTFLEADDRSKTDCEVEETDATPYPSFTFSPWILQSPYQEQTFDPFPSTYFPNTPAPDISFTVKPTSAPLGYGYDRCQTNDDCVKDYDCRLLLWPLIGPLYRPKGYFFGICSTRNPKLCTHERQCFSEEFCMSGVDFESDTFGVCVSIKFANAYFPNYFKVVFFPPGPGSNPDGKATSSFEPEISTYPSPGYSILYTPTSGLEDETAPSQYKFPSPIFTIELPSEEPSSSGDFNFFNFGSGLTFDRCIYKSECRGRRECVNYFGKKVISFACPDRCYCLPSKLQSCSWSSDCEAFEVCVRLQNSTNMYCISEDAIKGVTHFEVLPAESFTSFPEASYTPFVTPNLVSPEVENIPPNYPFVTPEPSQYQNLKGLSLSACTFDDDCVDGYACVATEYIPCSSRIVKCFCIANKGNGGTLCLSDKDCPLGEMCYPPERIDIVPSYCISIRVIINNLKDVELYYSAIVPRGIGSSNKQKRSIDWEIPSEYPNKAGTGSGLTGDVCRYSSDCANTRLCVDALSFGELCDSQSNCSMAFCYPKYFESCKIANLCDKGEVCILARGVYANVQRRDFSGESKQKICLSKTAATRNEYSPLLVQTPLPKTIAGIVAWKYAEKIVNLKLGGVYRALQFRATDFKSAMSTFYTDEP